MSAWIVKIEEELSRLEQKKIQSGRMYRLPSTETNTDRDARDVYRPYKVSIGPWNALKREEAPDLRWHPRRRAEEVKKDSLAHFLSRSDKPKESYLGALREVVEELKEAYDGLHPRWGEDSESFLEMLLLDGCFLLEFIYTLRDVKRGDKVRDGENITNGPVTLSDKDKVNPYIMSVLENREEMKCYVHDLLLLENQVPLLVLEKLHGLWTRDDRIKLLKIIVATFIPKNRVLKIERVQIDELESSLHILDMYRRILVHCDFKREKSPKRKGSSCCTILRWRKDPSSKPQEEFVSTNIPAATDLNKIGMGFTISDSTRLLDISFQRDTIKLPVIVVDGSTKSTFLNLIAFEKLIVTRKEVTSYMYFMGCLVQGPKDASLLQSLGIIVTTLPPYEVTVLFRRMSKHISLDLESLDGEYIEMLRMIRARFNKLSIEWRRDLFQTYLRSPWAVMSVMAAVLLFTVSIIQTIYTVLSYVRPK